MKNIIQLLNLRKLAGYVQKRWGKKALIAVFVIWLTKWILTIFFGAQIVTWFKDIF